MAEITSLKDNRGYTATDEHWKVEAYIYNDEDLDGLLIELYGLAHLISVSKVQIR